MLDLIYAMSKFDGCHVLVILGLKHKSLHSAIAEWEILRHIWNFSVLEEWCLEP